MGKIEFWRMVGAAYGFAFAHPGRLFRLSGLWLAGIAGLQALVVLHLPLAVRLVAAFGMALFIVGGLTAFPLAWHRLVLLGEERGFLAALRFGRREWRFLAYGLLVGALMAAPSLLVLGVSGGIAAALRLRIGIVAAVIPVICELAVWCLVWRLTLALPAIAVDETGAMLWRAWRRGRGNGTRLLLGSICCTVPFVVLIDAITWLQMKLGARTFLGGAVVGALPFVVEFLATAVAVGFLSRAFQQLARSPRDRA